MNYKEFKIVTQKADKGWFAIAWLGSTGYSTAPIYRSKSSEAVEDAKRLADRTVSTGENA